MNYEILVQLFNVSKYLGATLMWIGCWEQII